MSQEYAVYKDPLSMTEYYELWDEDKYDNLTDALKHTIYSKYLVKSGVFQRDDFKCQNMSCTAPESPLTIHHIRWRKNNGPDKARNLITLCQNCHKRYHNSTIVLKFADADYLPSHIRGHRFAVDAPAEIDWKLLKAQMRAIRKEFKKSGGKNFIGWDQVAMLMMWLFNCDYSDDDESYETV